MSNNPWKDIPTLEKIRVDSKERIAECYWFVNSNGKYGYLVETSKVDIDINDNKTPSFFLKICRWIVLVMTPSSFF